MYHRVYIRLSSQLLSVVCALIVAAANATTYYWDTNGSTAGIGSAGGAAANWFSNSWATGSSGTLATGAWPNTQPNADEAVFQGTAGAVNVGSDVFVNGLRFLTNNYTLASTGGGIQLSGSNPTITVSPPSNNNVATISAPLGGTGGPTLAGNSGSGSLKFLVLANNSATTPNSFSGPFTIAASGALRIGGAMDREQIPDNVDLDVDGVVDFVTSGGASDMKQEKVRNVTVDGASSIFSVGNGTDFVVNSIAGTNTTNISINGNSASRPGRLVVDGWSDGSGDLTLNTSLLRLNTTSGTTAIGGRVVVSGDITITGESQVINNNGGGANTAEWDDNIFTYKHFDFAGAAHAVHVADGTLSFTSRAPSHPLQVTSLNPGGTTVTKTGPGIWLWEHAVQTSFTGVTRVEGGVLRIGASERLADGADLQVAGGAFDLQGFSETVHAVTLAGGTITGTATAMLTSATDFQAQNGIAEVKLAGSVGLVKSTTSTVTVKGANTYTGATTVNDGLLLANGTHVGGGAYSVGPNGKLGGIGTINSSVIADGTIAPGESVGPLTIGGDLTFRAGSKLAIELNGTSADKIVLNNLDLSENESLEVSALAPPVGTGWLFAEYSGMRSGEFNAVTPGYAVDYSVPGQLFLRLAGDFDLNGRVDAADYVVWRNGFGSTYDEDDYNLWRSNFGSATVAATGTGVGTSAPEPTCAALALMLAAMATILRHRAR